MANEFLTAKEIAEQALPILQNNLVFPALINVDYSKTFAKKGDTIQVERPASFTAETFSTSISAQDVDPTPILVKLDTIADVSVTLTAKQMALNVDDLTRLVINPAMVAIAEKINSDGLNLYKYVPYWTGTSGTTPDGLDDFANASKILNTNKVPMSMRRAVWDPSAQAEFQVLDAIVGADKSGTTEALREGSIGRVMALDNYMSQVVKTHTAGLYSALADVTGTVDVDNNSTSDTLYGLPYSVVTLTSAAGASTATLLKGDLITLNDEQYTVLETTAAAASGVIASCKIYPALSESITDKTVTFPDVTAKAHVANLAFHRDAFAFVTRPLETLEDNKHYTINFGGLTLRVTVDYSITTKSHTLSMDILYGFAPLYPDLACRILG